MGCVKFQIHGEDRDFLKKSDHIWDAKKIYEQKKKFFNFFLCSPVYFDKKSILLLIKDEKLSCSKGVNALQCPTS